MNALNRLLNPYWCEQDPLTCRWHDAPGPAGFLHSYRIQSIPNVGLFNLMWLMLERPDFMADRRACDKETMTDVIFELQNIKLSGGRLVDLAALHSLNQFAGIVRSSKFDRRDEVLRACDAKRFRTDRLA